MCCYDDPAGVKLRQRSETVSDSERSDRGRMAGGGGVVASYAGKAAIFKKNEVFRLLCGLTQEEDILRCEKGWL